MRARLGALLVWLGLLVLAGCSTPEPSHFDSQASYNRTFDAATAAMSDQKMTFSTLDRRNGLAVGTVDGNTVTATIDNRWDGTVRVSFAAQNQTPAETELVKRVVTAYNARMAKLGMLGGFKDSGGEYKGPIPCPSGPAFCP